MTDFEDTVLDFDLNLLRQPTTCNNDTEVQSRADKRRRAIMMAKQRTITADILINRYYEKRILLNQTEKLLVASKDECKQICIDYKNVLEKCSKLENEKKGIQTVIQDLEAKSIAAENRCEAIQAHNKQLQLLLQEHESHVESLKVRNNTEKANVKKYEKKIESLEKDKEILSNHMRIIVDMVLSKKKMNSESRRILEKYRKLSNSNCDGSLSGGEDNDETDIFASPLMSPALDEANDSTHPRLEKHDLNFINTNVCSQEGKSILTDRDSDGIQEVISVDTGRGSSLAFSDSDKCILSPDYFLNDSPPNTDIFHDKSHVKLIDTATSPLIFKEIAHVATSPITFEPKQKVHKKLNKSKAINFNKAIIPLIMIDRAVSPMNLNHVTDATKPIKQKISSPFKMGTVNVHGDELHNFDSNVQERECLELNNSINLIDDSNSDCEIETILNTMRMSRALLTPIPSTPAKSYTSEASRATSSLKLQNDHSKNVCQEAAIIREENKMLHASIADLAKEIMSIKSLLKNQFINDNDKNKEYKDDHETFINKVMTLKANINAYPESRESCEVVNILDSEFQNSVSPSFTPDDDDVSEDHINESDTPVFAKPIENHSMRSSNMLSFEEESECQNVIEDINGNSEVPNNTICDNVKKTHKKLKQQKLTRLQKFKKKMLPRSKIQRAQTPPLRKLRVRPRQLQPFKENSKDLSATLNDKDVYENAVKIMAELNSKQKPNAVKTRALLNSKRKVNPFINGLDVNCNKKVPDAENSNKLKEFSNNAKELNASDVSNIEGSLAMSPSNTITTRSRSKHVEQDIQNAVVIITRLKDKEKRNKTANSTTQKVDLKIDKNIEIDGTLVSEGRKQLKRASIDTPEVQNKRMLRSSTVRQSIGNNNIVNENKELTIDSDTLQRSHTKPSVVDTSSHENNLVNNCDRIINYNDLDLFTDQHCINHINQDKNNTVSIHRPHESVLCQMLGKYGVACVKNVGKKIPDSVVNIYFKKIEDGITEILGLPAKDTKQAMNKLVEDIQSWNAKYFLIGLLKYLNDPVRKTELYNKVSIPPAPPMTKSEQILLYVVTQLQGSWPGVDIVDCVLKNIEYTLFKFNRTPEFSTIESMSHFYAVLCRYIHAKSRLRLFILDAMYCIQFKAVPLIKQCLDVWMHILPLAHMGIAKSSLVTCLVYLLHYYKCEDKFNRVLEIRTILSQKYFYHIFEWTEAKMLDMFKTSIRELRDIPIEKKMLRMALIILAKRQGPKWCQNNIIKNMLFPMIEKENSPERVKVFCISMIGPLLKPYPVDMKVHCEIVINQLIDMLNQTQSCQLQEAIYTSLIYMSKHNQNRVIKALLFWKPKQMSLEIEEILKGYVREKPAKVWKTILSRISFR